MKPQSFNIILCMAGYTNKPVVTLIVFEGGNRPELPQLGPINNGCVSKASVLPTQTIFLGTFAAFKLAETGNLLSSLL